MIPSHPSNYSALSKDNWNVQDCNYMSDTWWLKLFKITKADFYRSPRLGSSEKNIQ